MKTSNGIEIKSLLNHFLEHILGTMSNPTHDKVNVKVVYA